MPRLTLSARGSGPLGAACEFFRLPRNKEYFTEVVSYGKAGLTRLGIDAPQLTLCTAQRGLLQQ
jgi:hypothetical protein